MACKSMKWEELQERTHAGCGQEIKWEISTNMTVNASMLGLNGRFSVRDTRARQDMGTFASYTTKVPAPGVAFLKIVGTQPIGPGADK